MKVVVLAGRQSEFNDRSSPLFCSAMALLARTPSTSVEFLHRRQDSRRPEFSPILRFKCRRSFPPVRAELALSTEEGELERPTWTGDTPLSRFVGALISFKPFFSLMKMGARSIMIR